MLSQFSFNERAQCAFVQEQNLTILVSELLERRTFSVQCHMISTSCRIFVDVVKT
jgi:hypothetical protein